MIDAIVQVPGVGHGRVIDRAIVPYASLGKIVMRDLGYYKIAIDCPPNMTVYRRASQFTVLTLPPVKLQREPSELVQFLRAFNWQRSAA